MVEVMQLSLYVNSKEFIIKWFTSTNNNNAENMSRTQRSKRSVESLNNWIFIPARSKFKFSILSYRGCAQIVPTNSYIRASFQAMTKKIPRQIYVNIKRKQWAQPAAHDAKKEKQESRLHLKEFLT